MENDESERQVGGVSNRRWWQFSLLNLLSFVIAMCLLAAWYGAKSELAESKQEVQNEKERTKDREATISKLRKELGYVDIPNESKLYLIGTDTHDYQNMSWRWHLHLPKGKFRLAWTSGAIEESGDSKVSLKRFLMPLPESSGQFDLELQILRNLQSEPCLIFTRDKNRPQSFVISDLEVKSLQRLVHPNKHQQGGIPPEVWAPDQGPIDLLRIVSDKESDKETRLGLLVYIESYKDMSEPSHFPAGK